MDPVIEMRDVRFRYPGTDKGLSGVSFTVNSGECVGVIGPNGAGKSTLLMHLNALLVPLRGVVAIDNLDTSDPQNHRLIRSKVGLVFQDPNDQILKSIVEDEVAFGPLNMGVPRSEIPGMVDRALKLTGLEGYNSKITYHLSFGEKKRLSIASILVLDPPILALDEPTSNLDPQGIKNLLDILVDLKRRGKTLVIASHDLDFVAEIADRCYLIDRGIMVAEGLMRDVLSDFKLLSKHGLRPTAITRLFMGIGASEPYPVTFEEAERKLKRFFK